MYFLFLQIALKSSNREGNWKHDLHVMPFHIPLIRLINLWIIYQSVSLILVCKKEKQNTIKKDVLAVFNHKSCAALNTHMQLLFALKCLRNEWKQYLTPWKKRVLASLGNELTGRDERRLCKCTFVASGFYKINVYFSKYEWPC